MISRVGMVDGCHNCFKSVEGGDVDSITRCACGVLYCNSRCQATDYMHQKACCREGVTFSAQDVGRLLIRKAGDIDARTHLFFLSIAGDRVASVSKQAILTQAILDCEEGFEPNKFTRPELQLLARREDLIVVRAQSSGYAVVNHVFIFPPPPEK
ncbi:MAG: hypothetical protein ACKVOH_06500 [Chlamydiales bacterium]